MEVLFLALGLLLFHKTLFEDLKKVEMRTSLQVISIALLSYFILIYSISYLISGKGLDIQNIHLSWDLIVNYVILGPFVEELVNRFSLIILSEKKYVTYPSLIISSLVFMLGHQSVLVTNVYMGIVFFLLGLYLGYIYIRIQNIWYTIFTHSAYNCLVLLITTIFGI